MARLLYFGKLSDVTQADGETCDLPNHVFDTTALRTWVDTTRGFDGTLLEPSVRVAVNEEIVVDPFPIANTDEIAFLPPVGGG